ncbi:MAG: ABC transporter ATP-binding protein [Oscillospiraceae bacterium]|nr:ABC transporter ATP-binding protein [Oscillospiraceae bacterium]
MSLIEVKDVCKSYGKQVRVEALKGVSFQVQKGEMVSIIGKSGSGKSTILNILSGIDSIDKGEYNFNGTAVHTLKGDKLTEFRRKNIGFVVQHFALIDDYTIFDNIAMVLRYEKVKKQEVHDRIKGISKKLGIYEQLNKYPNELSGGQAQRAAIARAIVNHPSVLLADEPTGALDEATGETIMRLFRELNKSGMTCIIVTHDNKIAESCDRTIVIKDGRIEGGGLPNPSKDSV